MLLRGAEPSIPLLNLQILPVSYQKKPKSPSPAVNFSRARKAANGTLSAYLPYTLHALAQPKQVVICDTCVTGAE